MGLTSSGRGWTGDPGDFDVSIRRGVFFQGVREPVVSKDGSRGGLRELNDGVWDGVFLFERAGPAGLNEDPSTLW